MTEGRDQWLAEDGAVGRHIAELNERCLRAYQANDALIEENANAERIQMEGGYGRRQIWELIQNGADELLDERGQVEVVLTADHLYCANQGKPVTPEGAGALLSAYRSPKKGPEIGRFGLGFKSVLGVSTRPEFFSRTGSFGFDPARAKKLIEKVAPAAADVPTLRLAFPADPAAAAKEDQILADLMGWATTVVRLPLDRDTGEWLSGDLATFPAAFLVFSPHVSRLTLADRTSSKRRQVELRKSMEESEHLLVEGDDEELWRMFSDDFTPTPRAARDGGAMAKRDLIRFQWAVPVRSGQKVGRLWAHFPTLEETTLTGVLNAPWKLNDDRTRVIPGPFNEEILYHATRLILGRLEDLVDPEDPANVLDVLPARGKETRNWADEYLTITINDDAPAYPTVPDQSGELELPGKLSLSPPDLPVEALKAWSGAPNRPVTWTHPSVDATTTRRSRAERFIEAGDGRTRQSLADWLETLVKRSDVEAAAHALRIAGVLARAAPGRLEELRSAPIVVDAEGQLTSPASVFLPGEHELSVAGLRLVHPDLAQHDVIERSLRALGVESVSADRELAAALERGHPKSDEEWKAFWDIAAAGDIDDVVAIVRDADLDMINIRVQVVQGRWLPIAATLLPGDIVTVEEAPSVVVDVDRHRNHLSLLQRLGAVAAPAPGGGDLREPLLRDFEKRARRRFLDSLGAARPDESLIRLASGPIAGPVTPIEDLGGAAKARFTEALARAQSDFGSWSVSHPSTDRYRPLRLDNPVVEVIRDHGVVMTDEGSVGSAGWVGPGLGDWAPLLPVLAVTEAAARALQLPNAVEDLTEWHWTTAFERVKRFDEGVAARLYATAVAAGRPQPEEVLCQVNGEMALRAPGSVRVSTSAQELDLLRASPLPVLLIDGEDSVQALIDRWGMKAASDDIVSESVAIEVGERMALIDQFPAIRTHLDDAQRSLLVARCSELRIETRAAGGRVSEPKQAYLDGEVLFVEDQLSPSLLLRRTSELLGLGLDAKQIDRIIDNKLDQEIRKRISAIRKMKTDDERLAAIVDRADLEATLPRSLLEAAEEISGEMDHVGVARMALAVHGVETLKLFKEQLEDLRLQPPSSWTGSRTTVEFVRKLGFDSVYAGFEGGRRDAKLQVDGPPNLPDLHDYQEIVVDEIQRVLRRDGDSRGIVSLPTGAGKTRVAIQAIVEEMRERDFPSPILWVAQRDELCEQAVQAWSEIWRDRGPGDGLMISRLWASNDAAEAEDTHQVVVATIDKLDSGVVNARPYDWLKKASVVVIDEAHGATTPAYTRLLTWQGLDRKNERIPLVGLTATPFRGRSESEAKRLRDRFGGCRLDKKAFNGGEPYARLQDMGVLSRVQHRVLDGSEMNLSEYELDRVRQTGLLPSSVADRLAANVDRNRTLFESLVAHPDDWTTLVFCASVEHAQVMAALLNEAGVASAAVSGHTPPAARRHYVDQFRKKKLRVLTNYAVFAAGFDAPEVRALYVARPTYSPNVYQQMVGRGLRGPKNGGSEECLIVNVADNIINFADKLAFYEFEHLWDRAVAE